VSIGGLTLLLDNVRLRVLHTAMTCDTRNFWLAAYAERRVLFELTPLPNGAGPLG
jgi:hypothetical protein